MDYAGFLAVAEHLARQQQLGPASYRSAVSRAYYAAFHRSSELLETIGQRVPESPNAHSFVYRALSGGGSSQIKRAMRVLNELRTDRNHADYDLDRCSQDSEKQADYAVLRAQQVVKELHDQFMEPARSGLEQTVRSYLEKTGQIPRK